MGQGHGGTQVSIGIGSDSAKAAINEELQPNVTCDHLNLVCMAHGQANAEISQGYAPTVTCNHEAPIVVHGTQDPDTLHDLAHSVGRNQGQENTVICFDTTQITSPHNHSDPKPGQPCHSVSKGGHPPAVINGTAIRRLMPIEIERLFGIPDNHTLVPWRGGLASDTQRYAALGNTFAVPVVRWIGERIEAHAK